MTDAKPPLTRRELRELRERQNGVTPLGDGKAPAQAPLVVPAAQPPVPPAPAKAPEPSTAQGHHSTQAPVDAPGESAEGTEHRQAHRGAAAAQAKKATPAPSAPVKPVPDAAASRRSRGRQVESPTGPLYLPGRTPKQTAAPEPVQPAKAEAPVAKPVQKNQPAAKATPAAPAQPRAEKAAVPNARKSDNAPTPAVEQESAAAAETGAESKPAQTSKAAPAPEAPQSSASAVPGPVSPAPAAPLISSPKSPAQGAPAASVPANAQPASKLQPASEASPEAEGEPRRSRRLERLRRQAHEAGLTGQFDPVPPMEQWVQEPVVAEPLPVSESKPTADAPQKGDSRAEAQGAPAQAQQTQNKPAAQVEAAQDKQARPGDARPNAVQNNSAPANVLPPTAAQPGPTNEPKGKGKQRQTQQPKPTAVPSFDQLVQPSNPEAQEPNAQQAGAAQQLPARTERPATPAATTIPSQAPSGTGPVTPEDDDTAKGSRRRRGRQAPHHTPSLQQALSGAPVNDAAQSEIEAMAAARAAALREALGKTPAAPESASPSFSDILGLPSAPTPAARPKPSSGGRRGKAAEPVVDLEAQRRLENTGLIAPVTQEISVVLPQPQAAAPTPAPVPSATAAQRVSPDLSGVPEGGMPVAAKRAHGLDPLEYRLSGVQHARAYLILVLASVTVAVAAIIVATKL